MDRNINILAILEPCNYKLNITISKSSKISKYKIYYNYNINTNILSIILSTISTFILHYLNSYVLTFTLLS